MESKFVLFDIILEADATKNDALWNNVLKTYPYRYKVKTFDKYTNKKQIIYGDILAPIPNEKEMISTCWEHISLENIAFADHVYIADNDVKNIKSACQRAIGKIATTLYEWYWDTLAGKINVKINKIVNTSQIKLIYGDGSINKKTNQASYAIAVLDQVKFDPLDERFINNEIHNESFTDAQCAASVITGVIDNATSNVGELNALRQAINVGLKSPETVVCINCDSEYSIRCMREYIYAWNKNGYKSSTGQQIKNIDLIKAMYRELIDLMLQKTVVIRWVRGHNDDYFNELCDIEAKKALGIES